MHWLGVLVPYFASQSMALPLAVVLIFFRAHCQLAASEGKERKKSRTLLSLCLFFFGLQNTIPHTIKLYCKN